MKPFFPMLAAALVLTAPIAVQAQSRGGDHGFGGGRGGPAGDTSARGTPDMGGARNANGPSPTGAYRGARNGGPAQAGRDRRDIGRYRYPTYWGGLDLGFALGYSLAYPWYGDPAWGYGYYGPAYVYGPAGPTPYDDPFAQDYGSAPGAAADRPNGSACGNWVWNPDQSKYDWNTAGCGTP